MDAAIFPLVLIVASASWPLLMILVGWVADQRGQSGLLWFILSILISPIVAGILLVLFTPRPGERR